MILLALGLLAYAVSTVAFVGHLLVKKARWATTGSWGLLAGIVCHAVGKVALVITIGVPVKDATDALSLVGLCVAALFYYAARRYRVPVLGAFASPLVFTSLAASLAFSDEGAVPEALRSGWFPVHLFLAIGGDACFGVAGIAGIAYLLQERMLREKRTGTVFRALPPLHVLDEVMHRFISAGLLLLSLGMLAGSFWAKQRWGSYWQWDPKQCWTLVTWLLFAGILHARVTIGWRGRRAARLTVFAFASVFLAMVGLQLLVRTRHSGEYDGTKNAPAIAVTKDRVPSPSSGAQ